ncbi:hypothetical protein BamIOP4010DRAFT_0593 [Burkholderia ambifaria IOP40-10]|uniref:Uncharacterized protein n=1 Tax=Burkholderia ambifaria IOP40-10 TaxID=396596 RepID=B1F984_9BURK|nr:hypothetical protein BamIOP4010DRAFT_0593 [Burkholderia ambifaria IOP40-10]
MNLIPSTESIQRERVALEATYQREASGGVPHFERRVAITDPVITPFVRALKAEGFLLKADRSGCDMLGTCPKCQGRYLYTAIKDGIEHSLCPHCRNAEDRKRS